jgi:hypothetical protein
VELKLRLKERHRGPPKRGAAGREEGKMFVTIVENRVHVRLSLRNLRQLEAILDGPDNRHTCLARRDENGVSLVVQVENDADHYEERGPGQAFDLVE